MSRHPVQTVGSAPASDQMMEHPNVDIHGRPAD